MFTVCRRFRQTKIYVLEVLRSLPPVTGDSVVSALWWLFGKLSKWVSQQERSQMESGSSVQKIEKNWLLLGKMMLVDNMCVMEGRIPWWRHWTVPVVHTPSYWSATLALKKETYSSVTTPDYTTWNQFLYVVFERPWSFRGPKNYLCNPCLVEGDSLGETRRRFGEHKLYPESKDTDDESTLGDPMWFLIK
jgi:hypothetical protein